MLEFSYLTTEMGNFKKVQMLHKMEGVWVLLLYQEVELGVNRGCSILCP